MVDTAMIGVPPIFTHSDAFSGYEDDFSILTQCLDFCGLPFLLEVVFLLLRPADDFALPAATLKLCCFLLITVFFEAGL